MTDRLEHECYDYFKRIEDAGGMFAAIDAGFFRREIARASFTYQTEILQKRRLVVGVNAYETGGDEGPPILSIDPQLETRQIERLARTRAGATRRKWRALKVLEAICRDEKGPGNIMAALVDCARANATLGEMADVCRRVFGEYHKLAGRFESEQIDSQQT